MSDNQARPLLEEILAHPEDDTPRLIYADWLDEHGESARAEFIRVQIERASLPVWDARQVRLRLREEQLLEQHSSKWRGELPIIKGVMFGEFRRGFVATAEFVSFDVLAKNASACWAATPLEAIETHWPRRREWLEKIAALPSLRELSINAVVVDEDAVAKLAASPLLSTLRILNVPECNMGPQGFGDLIASPHLGNLTALRAPLNLIGNSGMNALFHAASLTSLTELDLSEAGEYGRYGEDPVIQEAGIQSLTAWKGMAKLRSLKLNGNELGFRGLRTLLRSPRTTALKELHLRGNGLTGQAMQEFGEARSELQLDILDLGENLLRDLGVAYLASARCCRELKMLSLDRCELFVTAAQQLAKAPFLQSVRVLNLNDNTIGADGLRSLLDAKPSALHTLELRNNNLGDEGAGSLANSPGSDSLLSVDLTFNDMHDHAAQALAVTPYLRQLLVMKLGSEQIGAPAAAFLSKSPLGQRLAKLDMVDPDEQDLRT